MKQLRHAEDHRRTARALRLTANVLSVLYNALTAAFFLVMVAALGHICRQMWEGGLIASAVLVALVTVLIGLLGVLIILGAFREERK